MLVCVRGAGDPPRGAHWRRRRQHCRQEARRVRVRPPPAGAGGGRGGRVCGESGAVAGGERDRAVRPCRPLAGRLPGHVLRAALPREGWPGGDGEPRRRGALALCCEQSGVPGGAGPRRRRAADGRLERRCQLRVSWPVRAHWQSLPHAVAHAGVSVHAVAVARALGPACAHPA